MIRKISALAAAAFLIVSVSLSAQDNRVSPPAKCEFKSGKIDIAVNYSQPSVKGRKIWGDLVPYGKVWRTGANEATTFETKSDILVGGKELKAGKYSLFTIPGEKEWTLILNSEAEQWGAYKYDESKDVLRLMLTPEKSNEFNEKLLITADAKDGGAVLSISWENLTLSAKISSAK